MTLVQQDAPYYNGDVNLWGSLITVIVVLVLIVALIILLARFLGKRNRYLSQSRSIRVLGAVGLGPNKSLQVIEMGDHVYLIGVGEDVSLIDKVSDPDEIAVLEQAFESEGTELSGLASGISNLISRFKKEPPQEEELEGTAFHEVFQSQLRKLPDRKRQMEELLQEPEEQSTDRSRDS
ncbi:flagellar biosynthetic protein FliO [Paenibacillus sanguinis]|uniref:flagellar biosynthetic protein FliO n=1 Tax=Paenibacillus sanguinis TaxID=225906 RepID=UPI00036FF462|nr:flagellar biosynthetic protein FliO [Paenibacillus sanguinis]